MENIAKAILAVMKDVKGVEKNMSVGTGQSSYKGVSDQDVKKIIGEAMQRNGLCLLPTSVKPKVEVSRWEENSQYGVKQKQTVFTEVQTKYLLLHSSGESVELAGYGHGVDTQDKGAGKATTYALKYALLYMFLVPTGKIDDTDSTHSDDMEVADLMQVWRTALQDQKTVEDLDRFYKGNEKQIGGNKQILSLFTERKKQLMA